MPAWLDVAIRVAGVAVAFLTLPLIVGQTEHKVMAHMQGRLGPMYAGAFHGWAQLIADGVKFVQKESITPAAADAPVFRLAPFVALTPYLVILLVIPLGPGGLVAQPEVEDSRRLGQVAPGGRHLPGQNLAAPVNADDRPDGVPVAPRPA